MTISLHYVLPAITKKQFIPAVLEFLPKPAQTNKRPSSDDTSIALLSHHNNAPSTPAATLHHHSKVTADNSQHAGIHPLIALESHCANLGPLIADALLALPAPSSTTTSDHAASATIPIRDPSGTWVMKRKPDFISVTRGPGMRASLSAGIDTARGLALALQIPLVGVNHMQAHALTPRLVSALKSPSPSPSPSFPFLSLLVSGGHTLLLHSQTLTQHAILAATADVAIGDVIDKMARVVCPESLLRSPGEIMYGRLLESFAFPPGDDDHGGDGGGRGNGGGGGGGGSVKHAYTAPTSRAQQFARRSTRWGWSLPVPLAEHKRGKERGMQFSFSGLGSTVERICAVARDMGREERVELAREGMRVAFEHLAVRLVWALDSLRSRGEDISTVVVSGGVASNEYLKTM